MQTVWPLLAFIFGLALGGGAIAFLLRPKVALAETACKERDELRVACAGHTARIAMMEPMRDEIDRVKAELRSTEDQLRELSEERARMDAQLSERQQSFQEQMKLIEDAKRSLPESFKTLSSEALKASKDDFLKTMTTFFEQEMRSIKGDHEQRKEAITEMLKPFQDKLGELQKHNQDLETKRVQAYAELSGQIRTLFESEQKLQSETRTLVSALKNPGHRGRWGEMQLKRVVEMAGLIEHVDFQEQVSLKANESRLRPDLIVNLPSQRTIVVDSKAPYESYSRALECENDQERLQLFQDHARSVRNHILTLAGKEYWRQLPNSPEFVVLFLPAEPVYSSALEHDPQLIELAVQHNVLIATPMTLIALFRAVAYGWRNEKLAENAKQISDLGRQLYDRIGKMAEYLGQMRRSLDSTVRSWDSLVGNIEGSVLPAARKIKDLDTGALKVIEPLEPIGKTPRALVAKEVVSRETAITHLFASEPLESGSSAI